MLGGRGQETGQYVQSPKESKYTGATLRRVQIVLWLEGGVPGERRLRCIRVFAETEKGLECQTHTPIPHLKPEVASASKCLLGSCCRPRLPTASASSLYLPPLLPALTSSLPVAQQRSAMAWRSPMSSLCARTTVMTRMPTAPPPRWPHEGAAAVPRPSQTGVGVS